MSITPSINPGKERQKEMEEKEQASMNAEKKVRVLGWLLAILFVAAGSQGFYAWWLSQHLGEVEQTLQSQIATQEQTLAGLQDRLGGTEERFEHLEGEVSATNDHLGSARGELRKTRQMATQLAEQQKQSAEVLSSQLGQLKQEHEATQGTVGSLSTDVNGVKQEVTHTKEELASTRSDLQRVVGDLGVQSGLIARNREELAELRLRGERDYYEFDLRKAKQPQRIGEVALLLKNADVKRQKYTLNLVADDRTIEKKDKTVNEPVQFYRQGARQPAEIVVNQIFKDRIVGYVSSPKKKEVRLSGLGGESGSSRSGS